MRKVFIDEEFKCHTTNPDSKFRAIETDAFDGACDEVIRGSRFVPEGSTWVREDGKTFEGEMKSVWKNSEELDTAQREYERKKLADAENALAILLGGESV